MLDQIFGFGQIIIADLILSGDNALIIGMAAASLAPELRKKAILYGMVIAALLRIVFALVATKLLGLPGLLFAGSLLLFWVCWRLYVEIVRTSTKKQNTLWKRQKIQRVAIRARQEEHWVQLSSRSRLPMFQCPSTMFWL